jgi:hypothetical protein
LFISLLKRRDSKHNQFNWVRQQFGQVVADVLKSLKINDKELRELGIFFRFQLNINMEFAHRLKLFHEFDVLAAIDEKLRILQSQNVELTEQARSVGQLVKSTLYLSDSIGWSA